MTTLASLLAYESFSTSARLSSSGSSSDPDAASAADGTSTTKAATIIAKTRRTRAPRDWSGRQGSDWPQRPSQTVGCLHQQAKRSAVGAALHGRCRSASLRERLWQTLSPLVY